MIDRTLWESLSGVGAGVEIFENDDDFRFDTYPSNLADGVDDRANGEVVPAGTPIGTGAFWTTDNSLMAFLTSDPQFSEYFDIDGCVVYPMDGSIDLRSFTQLEQGYASIDPDDANIDIRIKMSWEMPSNVTLVELEDPATIDPDDLQALYGNRKIGRNVAAESIYNFSVAVEVQER